MVVSSVRPPNGTAVCVNTEFGTPLDSEALGLAVAATLQDRLELCATPPALRQAFAGRLQQHEGEAVAKDDLGA